MRTYKILGFLLTYPSEIHREAAPECLTLLRDERLIPQRVMAGLERLCQELLTADLLDLQEAYVALFDRTPSLSLHVFEHVHGDSRARGQAMVDLVDVYLQAGLTIDTMETPDYLPMFLEYLSTLSAAEAVETLANVVDVLTVMAERTKKRETPYVAVFDALVALTSQAGKTPNPANVAEALQRSSGASETVAQIDRTWEEQYAFAPAVAPSQSADCPRVGSLLEQMSAPLREQSAPVREQSAPIKRVRS